jgi:hypothetical protein
MCFDDSPIPDDPKVSHFPLFQTTSIYYFNYNQNVKFIKQIFVSENEYNLNIVRNNYHHSIIYDITKKTDLYKFYNIKNIPLNIKFNFAITFNIIELLNCFDKDELCFVSKFLTSDYHFIKNINIEVFDWLYYNIEYVDFDMMISNYLFTHNDFTQWFFKKYLNNISNYIKFYEKNNVIINNDLYEENKENNECIICYEKSNIKTICNHYYCNQCFTTYYFFHNNKKCCTICNQSLLDNNKLLLDIINIL